MKNQKIRQVEGLLNPGNKVIEVLDRNEFKYLGQTYNLKELLKIVEDEPSIMVLIKKDIPKALKNLAYPGGQPLSLEQITGMVIL